MDGRTNGPPREPLTPRLTARRRVKPCTTMHVPYHTIPCHTHTHTCYRTDRSGAIKKSVTAIVFARSWPYGGGRGRGEPTVLCGSAFLSIRVCRNPIHTCTRVEHEALRPRSWPALLAPESDDNLLLLRRVCCSGISSRTAPASS